MGEENEMNLHCEAEKLRNEIQGLLASVHEKKPLIIVSELEDFLREKGVSVGHITLWRYLNETTPPGWLMPHLVEFLTQEPYIRYQNVWRFIQEYGAPIKGALDRVKAAAFRAKNMKAAEAASFDEFL